MKPRLPYSLCKGAKPALVLTRLCKAGLWDDSWWGRHHHPLHQRCNKNAFQGQIHEDDNTNEACIPIHSNTFYYILQAYTSTYLYARLKRPDKSEASTFGIQPLLRSSTTPTSTLWPFGIGAEDGPGELYNQIVMLSGCFAAVRPQYTLMQFEIILLLRFYYVFFMGSALVCSPFVVFLPFAPSGLRPRSKS